MDQIGNPTELSMCAIQASDFIGQVLVLEFILELVIEFLVAALPFDETSSRITTGHFDLGVPLVPRCAAGVSVFVEGNVGSSSHGLEEKGCCCAPTVHVDDLPQVANAGCCPQHRICKWLVTGAMF